MPRPFEVVRVAAVNADVAWRSIHYADVFDLLSLVQVEEESVVQHLDLDSRTRRCLRLLSFGQVFRILLERVSESIAR
jgi:hypothetical protein